MENMNKMKKVKLVVQVLLMYCWAITIGHRILNKYLYNMLGPESKAKLEPFKEIIFNSGELNCLRNPDQIDEGTDIKHNNYKSCKGEADEHTNLAVSYYKKGKYREAAYELSYGFHYVQDMACPVHRVSGISSKNHQLYENPTDPKDVLFKIYCTDYASCEDFQAVKDAYNDPNVGMGDKLTELLKKDNGTGNEVGFEILNRPAVKDYIANRWSVWYGYYNPEPPNTPLPNTAKKRAIQDLALAAAIQKRYLKSPGIKEEFFDK